MNNFFKTICSQLTSSFPYPEILQIYKIRIKENNETNRKLEMISPQPTPSLIVAPQTLKYSEGMLSLDLKGDRNEFSSSYNLKALAESTIVGCLGCL